MSTSASPISGSPPSFFRRELESALSEQAFGIASYTMDSASAFEATATVVLLERVQIVITLTIRGYQVSGGSASMIENAEFESLEALLQHHSTLYATKRAEVLAEKLTL